MKIIRNIVLILLFTYIAAYLYTYDPVQQAHINEQIEKIKESKKQKFKSDFELDKSYEKCGDMDSSGKYISGSYGVEFFYPSCHNYNFYCKDGGYCGMSPDKSYECKQGVDCGLMLSITDEAGDLILKGIDGFRVRELDPSHEKALALNEEVFGDVVKLQQMPDDFPYLVLKDTSFGSWGRGYYYHLYSTHNKFKKVIEIGPSYKGFYKDPKGNYIIDIQQNYWPEFGSNADHLTDEISYRFLGVDEYQSTGKLFAIDMDAIKSRVISFSDKEIARLMTYAKQSNKKIVKAFNTNKDWHYFWTPGDSSKKWPLKLLRIRESDPSNGYVYGDLFDLVRNGRIDLAKKYFDALIPNQYNEHTAILPEFLNTKEKLWKGYLNDLKDQSTYRRNSSSSIFFPDEATKDLYWQIFKLLNTISIKLSS